jgi:hypothetical protein
MKTVLDEAVKIVNFIKVRPLNSRLFSALYNEIGSDHEHLLLFELRDEVRLFLHKFQI